MTESAGKNPMEQEMLLTFRELAALPGFRVIRRGRGAAEGFSSVSVDSRTVKPGALFVALKGARADGHRFVAEAFRSGAAAAMVAAAELRGLESGLPESGAVLVAVPDTLHGFQAAAARYLERFPSLLRVGITGSSGKTTVKEIAAAMLGAEKNTFRSRGNFNSETGLPLSVFDLRPWHEAGVFEMGMNRKGEIAELAGLLRPRIALVTNIGAAHIGMIGSIEGIVEEKKQIFLHLSPDGTALVPEDEPWREKLLSGVPGNTVCYGPASLEELGAVRVRGLEGAEITWEGIPARFSLPGRHNLKNALAALAIAKAAGISGGAVRRGLESVRPLFGRSEVLRVPSPRGGEIAVFRDCYNSNPASARAALEFSDGLDWPGRRIYVMGSMLELGEASVSAHEELGRLLAASRADRVFFCGAETVPAFGAFSSGGGKDALYAETAEELSRLLADLLRADDFLLLKGSRGCALERALEGLPAALEAVP